ncbi:MAG: alpha/beta fold hydrolase [Labilithrix sp.]|nr:alpha/beta fold hydrolase [Labilithrix sp.]
MKLLHAALPLALALVPLSQASCSSSAPEAAGGPDAGAAEEAEEDAGAAPVEWTKCTLQSEGKGPSAECARIPVPLDAKAPGGKTIDFFVKRYRPKGGKHLRALWMLQGGPGGSGYVFEKIAEQMATRFPDVDYYIPDHRGTGESSRLGCPAEEASDSEAGLAITNEEWATCLPALKAAHGEDLRFYDTTQAANDLGVAIARIQTSDPQPAFVLGVSYGTYWAHRYLQLFPGQASGVILDSIVPPGTSLARQDADSDEAARDFLNVCKGDALCGEKMGPDPWAKTQALFAKLKTGHCPDIALPDFPTHILFRRAFAGLLMDPTLRTYIPPVIYRADRCEPRDVTALKVFVDAVTQEGPESEMMKQWGWGLTYNIIFSELWENPAPTASELALIRDNAVASRDITEQMSFLYEGWPRYSPDPSSKAYADTDTPMLFLQGGLDPATLLRKARPMREHFTRPHQTWVEVPTAGHTVFASSTTSEGRSCGTRMIMGFLEDPKRAVDTSCIADVVPLDFSNPRTAFTSALFGTTDAWE